ncbi:MAG: glutaredoxin family protein [Methylococcaceae bacterium]|jgi:hypothetical protein
MQLLLFGTTGCHLCEQAKLSLYHYLQINKTEPIILEEIDIAEQEEWQVDYALRIPVLFHPETKQELGWPFDGADVQSFIDGLKQSNSVHSR